MIEVTGLTKFYGDKPGVKNVSFRIEKGETVGLLGPNGAGKTTIMKMLACHMLPSRGSITLDGVNAVESPKEVARRIGFLPEFPPLYPDMEVYSYLGFIADIKGIPANRRAAHLAKIMELTAIADVKRRLIKHLSKGYRQRVGLAHALVGFPDVLILDEPTVGLDPRQINEVRKLIEHLAREHTIILSSHILAEIKETCKRIIIIREGRIVLQDTIENLEQGSKSFSIRVKGEQDKVKRLLASAPGVSRVEPSNGLSHETGYCGFRVSGQEGLAMREEIFHRLAAADLPIVELRSLGNTLEEVFIELTSRQAAGGNED
jgi:gliding motility-associated transport system ATP-binding protein